MPTTQYEVTLDGVKIGTYADLDGLREAFGTKSEYTLCQDHVEIRHPMNPDKVLIAKPVP